jgi:murein DD-endopeptidase MepM/ murein hydrolase activator NlpD
MLRRNISGFILVMIVISSTVVWAVNFPVSSGFGWRIDPFTHKRAFHTGVDIPAKAGAPIFAIFKGKVIVAGAYRGYGIAVLLHHKAATYTLYGHCSRVLVKPGQTVRNGEEIARVGSTGISTGPHVHLEYWVNGRYRNPMEIWNR